MTYKYAYAGSRNKWEVYIEMDEGNHRTKRYTVGHAATRRDAIAFVKELTELLDEVRGLREATD